MRTPFRPFVPAMFLLAAVAAAAAAAAADDGTLLLRQPALSADHLAFVYAGDLWVAKPDGSEPRRLTSHPAEERDPVFSPDGSKIAFEANYANNEDVWVIDVAGGQPRRLTWHPADDTPTGWTPDGRSVTFVSDREVDHGRSNQWYHAPLAGGLPTKRMEARVFRGALDPAGRRLAYIDHGSGYGGLFGGASGWRGYRGGTTPDLRVLDLDGERLTTIPGAGATNFNPIWLDGVLWFISDRGEDKVHNLYRWNEATGATTRVTDETVWDIRSASGHGDTIVYEAGGRLKRLDVAGGSTREISISIAPDLPQLRTQWKDASRTIQGANISPTGKRAIVTARGEVFTVPVDEGSTRNLTGTPSGREYFGSWSPGGDRVAWIEDDLDGQRLVIADQAGGGERRRIELGPHFHRVLDWGPGEPGRIVLEDNHLALRVLDPVSGTVETIARQARRERFDVAFSPDGRWLAYTLEQPNYHRDLMLHDFDSGTATALTDGSADVASPAFSRDGAYLYFAASTNSGPIQVGLNMTSQERPYRAGLYAVVLAADGDSPLLPGRGDENEDEKKEDDPDPKADASSGKRSKSKKSGGDESKERAGGGAEPTRIDLDGIRARIVGLPVAERNHGNLAVADGGDLYYVRAVQPGASVDPPGRDDATEENALMRFDREDREEALVLRGVSGFSLAAGGKHLLISQVDGPPMTAEIADSLKPEPLSLSGLRVQIDPRAEWATIFDEVWRMEREYFYDPGMHGLDWQAIYQRYRPLVDHVGRREDLNALLVEMIGEMQVGHNNVGGGDVHRENGVGVGLLGANLELRDGRYRLARVYSGESWNPHLRAPLATPGNEAREGEYILAVDGRELTAADNLFERLHDTLERQVALRVGPHADGRDAREIVVEPVRSERLLRLWHWIETNRRAVDEATGGRVGYVYLPNTAGAGYTLFNRMFFSQVDREALIVDERSNSGGQAANYITDVLSRRHLSSWKDRDGLEFDTPAGAIHGPMVMLIDQDAGSGGDYLPYSFRHLGLGPLIGTRTWGGLIGIAANPGLIDGGGVSVPFFRFYDANREWTVENEGVAPDIEVELDPIATNRGRDTQLARAIEEVLARLERHRATVPDRAPAYPTELGR